MSGSVDPHEKARYEPSHLTLCCLQKYHVWFTGLKVLRYTLWLCNIYIHVINMYMYFVESNESSVPFCNYCTTVYTLSNLTNMPAYKHCRRRSHSTECGLWSRSTMGASHPVCYKGDINGWFNRLLHGRTNMVRSEGLRIFRANTVNANVLCLKLYVTVWERALVTYANNESPDQTAHAQSDPGLHVRF